MGRSLRTRSRNGVLGSDGRGRGRLVGNPELIVANALSDRGKVGRPLAEHLLNFRLRMGCFRATEESLTQTKQMKIGLCEQVRVN